MMKLPTSLTSILLGCLFIVPGLVLFYSHYEWYGDSVQHLQSVGEAEISIEMNLSLQDIKKRKELRFLLPQLDPYWQVINEQYQSGDFSLGILQENGKRRAIFSIRQSKQKDATVNYVLSLQRREINDDQHRSLPKPVGPQGKSDGITKLRTTLYGACGSKDEFTPTRKCLQKFIRELLSKHKSWLLRVANVQDLNSSLFAEQFALLLQGASLDARAGVGIPLTQSAYHMPLRPIITINGRYVYDLRTQQIRMRKNYFIWGSQLNLIDATKGVSIRHMHISTTTRKGDLPRMSASADKEGIFSFMHERYLNLSRLPLSTQVLYEVVLLLPLATLIIALFRNIVGILTFGTFMPALLALSYLEAGLLQGIALTILIIGLGILSRWFFDQMHLLLVPRLAATLTTVTILFLMITQLSYEFGWKAGLVVPLFPIVVLTMLIERINVVVDEYGLKVALVQSFYTLLAAFLCFEILSIEYVKTVFFAYPEVLLIILGCSILLGRYTGYRMTELVRFRELARPKEKLNGN